MRMVSKTVTLAGSRNSGAPASPHLRLRVRARFAVWKTSVRIVNIARPTLVRRIIVIPAVVLGMLTVAAIVVVRRAPPGRGLVGGVYWAGIEANIAREFPDVRQLDTAELAAWGDDPTRDQPLIVDVRTMEEYEVSHLPGARHAETADEVMKLWNAEARKRPVVVYCSVGWRSSVVADALRDAGPPEVWNLRGSIFRWANEGRALENHGAPAHRVHPFDQKWGELLHRELWPPEFQR